MIKYWKIWDNHQCHFSEALDNFIITTENNKEVILLCPEEFEIKENYDYNKLLKFRNAKIIFGTYNKDYYKNISSKIQIELWPNYFLYHSAYCSVNTIRDEKIHKLFTCMNKNIKPHRCLFIDLLAKHNLLDSNFYTWHEHAHYDFKHWIQKKNTLDGKFVGQQNCFPKQMYQSVFDVITESTVHAPFVTEKTYNAILFKKPFLIYGYKGIHKYLESIGYQLNHNVVDYSFDDEDDWKKRAELLILELKRLSTLNLRKIHKKMKKTSEYNFQHAKNQIKNHYGIPDIIFEDNYYVKQVKDAVCKLDLLV